MDSINHNNELLNFVMCVYSNIIAKLYIYSQGCMHVPEFSMCSIHPTEHQMASYNFAIAIALCLYKIAS